MSGEEENYEEENYDAEDGGDGEYQERNEDGGHETYDEPEGEEIDEEDYEEPVEEEQPQEENDNEEVNENDEEEGETEEQPDEEEIEGNDDNEGVNDDGEEGETEEQLDEETERNENSGDNGQWNQDEVAAEDYGEDQVVQSSTSYAADGSDGNSGGEGFNFSGIVKGAMDGFGGGGIESIIGHISSIGGEGGLTNMMSSGGMQGIVEKYLGEACHNFLGINPETGSIIGSIAGNLIFNRGGKGNMLGGIGKIVLDNIISGKFKRKIDPFVPPIPSSDGQPATTFGLDFYTERDRCLRDKVLFEDPEFPACDRSLYYKTPADKNIVWMRPSDIVSDPQLIIGQQSRFDVKQGSLGDCWLLAAVANLTLRDELFHRVVPPDQSFTENYAGIFHFQFWRYGKWVDVVVDDRLPTEDGQLCYMHSRDHNEFWSALLEKAYAKLYGSYENLEGGSTSEALEDFTGGLTEYFDLKKMDKTVVMAMMIRGFQMGSLFGCSIDEDPNEKEAPLSNGLIRGHAYSMTALHNITDNIVLVRIRNPWGNNKEWNGAWSDDSSEWSSISSDARQQLGVVFDKDGEFWMSFDDFMTNFQNMEVCNLSAAVMDEISQMTGVAVDEGKLPKWEERAEDGEWSTSKGTAGGCTINQETYGMNPQFGSFFTVTDDSLEGDGKCTVIVAVLQKYRREMRTVGQDSLPIGFAVYSTDQTEGPLPSDFFQRKKPVAKTTVFINLREVTSRFRVPSGHYVIIPCTFDPNQDGEFLLRIYANGAVQAYRLQ